MTEKPRSFSQTKVRDTSAPAVVVTSDQSAQIPADRQVLREASLDPRAAAANLPRELGGPKGPEPTRFGDWEHNGRCSDF